MKNKTPEKQNKAKILSFHQDIDFFLKRGEAALEDDDLLAAFKSYRAAYESDPTDLDSCLGLADVLSRMQRYEESNRMLLVDMCMNDPDPEHYYGLATNYYGMQEFDYARESLQTYLEAEPDGAYAEDAQDFLEVLDDESELAYMTGTHPDETLETLTWCTRAHQAMECGQADMAEEMLRSHLKEVPDALRAKNLLAVIEYTLGKKDQAEGLLDEIISEDPQNIEAISTKGILLLSDSKTEEAEKLADQMEAEEISLPEDLNAISLFEVQLKRFDQAVKHLELLLDSVTYDPQTLQRLAVSYVMTGSLNKAREIWLKLTAIDPDDTVAQFYLKNLEPEDAQRLDPSLAIMYDVPLLETLKRFSELHQMLSDSKANIRRRWQRDRDTRNLIRWALYGENSVLKADLLKLLGTIGDLNAERMLRDYLLLTNQKDSDKQLAVQALKQIRDVRPVYMLFISGHWAQGQLDATMFPNELPKSYLNILTMLQSHNQADEGGAWLENVAYVLHSMLLKGLGVDKPIVPPQQSSFAAAVELLAKRTAGEAADEKELVERYGITPRRLQNAVNKIGEVTFPEDK